MKSRGCRTCKERRVKCDATQPECARCQKAKRQCVWDPNEHAGLLFKSENAHAQGAPRRPRVSRPGRQTPVASPPPSTELSCGQPSTALSLPLEEHAFLFWANQYTFRSDDLDPAGHEYTTYILPQWIRTEPDSSLHLALSACCHATFGRAKNLPQAIGRANRLYGQALSRTHQAVSVPGVESTDQLLLSIMLMGFHENVIHGEILRGGTRNIDEVGSRFWKIFCHSEGALALLKLRRQMGDSPDSPLDRVTRRQLLRSSILRGVAIPDWLVDGAKYGETGPVLGVDALMVRVAALRFKSLAMFTGTGSGIIPDFSDMYELGGEARELEISAAKWSWAAPEEWRYSTQPAGDGRAGNISYDGTMNSYTSHGHAAVWLRYWAVRLITNSIMIRTIFTWLQTDGYHSHLVGKLDLMRKVIDKLAHEMCASVPYFFNAANATQVSTPALETSNQSPDGGILPRVAALVAWPLTVAVSTEALPEEPKQWLQGKLKVAAKALGDQVLESVADRGEFKF